jgi:hypothetical protein
MVLSQFKPYSDRPNVFWFQRSFLADYAALVPCRAQSAMAGKLGVSMTDPPIRHAPHNDNPTLTQPTYHRMRRRIHRSATIPSPISKLRDKLNIRHNVYGVCFWPLFSA